MAWTSCSALVVQRAGSLGTCGAGTAGGDARARNRLSLRHRPLASRSRLGLESRAKWLLAIERLKETLAPLISKLPRMQEADLKLAELMVLGVWTKRFALKSCRANIFVYELHTSSKVFVLFAEK